jgi:hypothetical protein
MTAPKAAGKIMKIMKTPPEEKILEGVWDEVVVKGEGTGQEEAAVEAAAVKAGGGNNLSSNYFDGL